ncbi:hypothetical protein E5E91_00385 [Deinococcus radiodurans R1 = ATCC 13939 = DSM 20539]|uniref:Uncharacterized protein n=2 Tax=Deinococcus radiodurans TaxID=1299 RepID=Q9RY78_DEIRA|nr:hypothetical protein DR_0072 [Deinococcus radiodurans R1 = ATCC 13939 = DSM 20539]QEM72048.1 hypothetical protein DXG80_09980 [Deinococcus radiodurans]UDK99283.1 hypothetical protein E5E91_00385 [Deinococcus radiodurans R1 = ATCC 13939 = DSM 20539]HCE65618.1 hypothetical protein [Deinococcus radiodurans]
MGASFSVLPFVARPEDYYARMKRVLSALVLGAGLLTACRSPSAGADDLTTRVLFTANGSYDAQADQRGKVPGTAGLRRVEWRTRPPLGAQAVTVEYDGEQRPQGWQMTVQQPPFAPADLAGPNGQAVQTKQGAGTLVRSGPLAGVLLLPGSTTPPAQLRLLTRGYAVQHEPELLPAFGQ